MLTEMKETKVCVGTEKEEVLETCTIREPTMSERSTRSVPVQE